MIPVKAKDVLAMDRQYLSVWAVTSSRIIPGPAADVGYDWLTQHKIHIVCENREMTSGQVCRRRRSLTYSLSTAERLPSIILTKSL